MQTSFGLIALLGSGETAMAGGRIFETVAGRYPRPLRISVLETPAGFELNSSQVAGRIADFLKNRLGNYSPRIDIIPARKRGTPFSPDDPKLLQPLLDADLIFMGPGSPTYAVRQLKGTLTWELIRARHRLGMALVFASAAAIAIGARAIPIYEVYKVGEDVTCPPGLDFFADFGLGLSCIPHWNNADGGPDVDTSRCFIGVERFEKWYAMLPAVHTTLGLDEHTGLIIDFNVGTLTVSGVGSVTLLREYKPEIFPAGSTFSVSKLGELHCPERPEQGIPAAVWEMVRNSAHENGDALSTSDGLEEVPGEVQRLLEDRQAARLRKEWAASDNLRHQIASLGWVVLDTPQGQKVVRQS